MRLINTNTLKIEEFWRSKEYVILSHTWGENEISFQQFQSGALNDKIRDFCDLAKRDGFQYAWVDTCCIDKTSSAELSEALNSMYKWYREATICYAYLEDIASRDTSTDSALKSCKWFRRGWTLQELIAPSVVEFYACDWTEIGTKLSLNSVISQATGIPSDILAGLTQPKNYNVAERMSWASGRHTTRKEDKAYSLLGIFNIHMPMLYGEGSNAFQRLQEEILRVDEDLSIFAWPLQEGSIWTGSLFATSPAAFSPNLVPYRFSDLINFSLERLKLVHYEDLSFIPELDAVPSPPVMTNRGFCITLPLFVIPKTEDEYHLEGEYLAPICSLKQEGGWGKLPELLCMTLQRQDTDTDICTYARINPRLKHNNQILKRFTTEELVEFEYETVYIPRNYRTEQSVSKQKAFLLSTKLSTSTEYRVEISKVYAIKYFNAPTIADLLPLPLPQSSISYFNAGIGSSGLIVLTWRPISGGPENIVISFGLENSTPWVKPIRSCQAWS